MQTDADGRFRFRGLLSGKTVHVGFRHGQNYFSQSLTLKPGESRDLGDAMAATKY